LKAKRTGPSRIIAHGTHLSQQGAPDRAVAPPQLNERASA